MKKEIDTIYGPLPLHIDDRDLDVLGEIIRQILKMMHGDEPRGYMSLHWRNGHSPYEKVLELIELGFGIRFNIEWRDDGRTVRSVKIYRNSKGEAA
jgi:hypothetical protein